MVGPSVGHFYAGNIGHGLLTSGLRSVVLAGGTVAALAICWDYCDDSEETAAIAILVGSAALTLGSAVYDIATAPGAARKYNEKKRLSRFSIGPTYIAAESTPGIAAQYRF